jgi:hypothetical protein
MRFGKNVLSQNLRTNCDLALYLTLFTSTELEQRGLPVALEARPGVGSLRDAGVEQETLVYNRLAAAFGPRCLGTRPDWPAAGRWAEQPLARLLDAVADIPCVLVQPKFEFDRGRLENTLRRLGVADADLPLIPDFGGFIPDVVLVEPGAVATHFIAPTGERLPAPLGEHRFALSSVDVKHAQEPNPSYESEAVLYAVLLANWILENGYDDVFFVNAEVFLWTRGGVAHGTLQNALDCGEQDAEALCTAMRQELEPISLPIYAQAIRRFFAERMPAVVRTGNADWRGLDWHVAPTCQSCDWLGFQGWLNPRDRPRVAATPEHYCFPRAERTDHVSRLPLITRGSRRVLENNGVRTVAQVAATTGTEPVYGEHTRLKSDRRSIPGFAVAVATGQPATDPDRTDGIIARYSNLDVYLMVNFDPGAGFITGIGLQAAFQQPYPFGQRPADAPSRRWRERWVVAAKSAESERGAVLAFLQQLASIFEHVHDADPQRGGPHAARTQTQIIFWDRRQFHELCLALGRHLPAILYLNQGRLVQALAWLFPAEELQEREELVGDRRPPFAFVKDTIRRLVRLPAPHALTLFGTAESYHHGDQPFNPPDSFYREPLSDTIPRERIYEIWALSAGGAERTIRWGGTIKTYNQLMDGFARTIDRQTQALSLIVWRLRRDFAGRLRAEAPQLQLTVPNWAVGVAHDSKLWIAWANFEAAVSRATKYLTFTADPEEVEAANEGLRLTEEIDDLGNGTTVYRVSEESLNTKLRAPNEYLCLSPDSMPGFLALPARSVIPYEDLPAHLRWMANFPMHKLFVARLEAFDRAERTAVVSLGRLWGQRHELMEELRDLILQERAYDFAGALTLLPSIGGDKAVERLERILTEVGNPAIAVPAPETLVALGAANRAPRPGNSAVSSPARVLWQADQLHAAVVRDAAAVQRILGGAAHADLNASQVDGVRVAASRGLAVIWGPPGTGKTKTCAALIRGVVAEEAAVRRRGGYLVLLTGPTYKAVGELVERVLLGLAADPNTRCRFYTAFRPGRPDRFPVPVALPEYIDLREVIVNHNEESFLEMRDDLEDHTRDCVVVVAAVTHVCARIGEQLARLEGSERALWPLFDFVLMDETSQIDMTTGVMPLSLLKPDAQLVIAGDHLQMPPVVQADAPVGAEHLVGSLQTYLTRRFVVEPTPLLVNYRSSAEIVDYIRRLGYPAGLIAGNPHTRISLLADPAGFRQEMAALGLSWSDAWPAILDPARTVVAATYVDGMAGQANPFEASCVASLVWLLRQCSANSLDGRPGTPSVQQPWDEESFWTRGVGIVTPHRAQRAQVVRALTDVFPQTDPALIDGAVDTVERFQGGERHTILISFGVGDPDVIRGEERFLLQLERTNVAISRAMGKCIVLLSEEMANHIPDDRAAAATAHALRGVVDEWCIRRQDFQVPVAPAARTITVRWR